VQQHKLLVGSCEKQQCSSLPASAFLVRVIYW